MYAPERDNPTGTVTLFITRFLQALRSVNYDSSVCTSSSRRLCMGRAARDPKKPAGNLEERDKLSRSESKSEN